MAEVQSWEMKALIQTFLSLETHHAFPQGKTREEQPWEKSYSHYHTVKNDRDFNSKKLWKCYSKNPLNG